MSGKGGLATAVPEEATGEISSNVETLIKHLSVIGANTRTLRSSLFSSDEMRDREGIDYGDTLESKVRTLMCEAQTIAEEIAHINSMVGGLMGSVRLANE